MSQLGQHGGRVRRKFMMGDRKLVRGDILSPDELCRMPVGNRRALVGAGYIEVFTAPDDLSAAKAARDTKSKSAEKRT